MVAHVHGDAAEPSLHGVQELSYGEGDGVGHRLPIAGDKGVLRYGDVGAGWQAHHATARAHCDRIGGQDVRTEGRLEDGRWGCGCCHRLCFSVLHKQAAEWQDEQQEEIAGWGAAVCAVLHGAGFMRNHVGFDVVGMDAWQILALLGVTESGIGQ